VDWKREVSRPVARETARTQTGLPSITQFFTTKDTKYTKEFAGGNLHFDEA